MQATPALPWESTEGGVIRLKDPISRQSVVLGLLPTVVRQGMDGPFINAVYGYADGHIAITVDGDELWHIDAWEGAADTLEIKSSETGVTGYYIWSINRTF